MDKDKKGNSNYRTFQFVIKEGHFLNEYLMDMMYKSNNLYNATNFHIRQIYTGFRVDENQRHPLQQEVIELFSKTIPVINKHNTEKFERLIKEDMYSGKIFNPKSYRKVTRFKMPTANNKFIRYELLDAVFKFSHNPDYRGLPSHINQGVMKTVFNNWSSFFESIKRYNVDPSGYTGRPKPPRYKTKGTTNELYFTNQVCKINQDKSGKKFLKFPKTKLTFNLSKHLRSKIDSNYKLVQVRAQKFYKDVKLEIVLDCSSSVKELIPQEEIKNVMALDLGVNNIVAGVANNGMNPFLINGKPIKSINQYYNKLRAHYCSFLRLGKNPNEGNFTSSRLDGIDRLRNLAIKDYLHKVSRRIVNIAVDNEIHKVIVGYNPGWKNNVEMRKEDKQNFTMIPFRMLLNMLKYKLNAEGIHYEEQEESYTSKASFIDCDDIPTYKDAKIPRFSGKRVERGLYISKRGISINADINAAGNILRKHSEKEIIIDYKLLSNVKKITIKKGDVIKKSSLNWEINSKEIVFG